MKKLLSLLLILLMALCLTGCKKVNGSVTILYTNDVHTYIDNESENEAKEKVRGLSYASLKAMKDDLISAGEEVILVDDGDYSQGTYYGGISEGEDIVNIMNVVGYDVGTFGNHEFDYGQFGFFKILDSLNFDTVSCNFYNVGENESLVLPAYKVIEKGGLKIAFVGISTPETISKSTPSYFMDADDNYIYNFYAGKDGQELYDAVQKAVDAAKKEADVVIALAHLGVGESAKPYTSEDVIANTTGLSAVIDGHSHNTIESEIVLNKDGEEVLLTQTGSYFSNIGKMKVDVVEGVVSISTELISEYENRDAEIDKMEQDLIDRVDAALGTVICETSVDLLIQADGGKGNRLVRRQETNIADLVADGIYWYFNEVEELDCDIALINGGGVRENLYVGPLTYADAKKVQPFGNIDCIFEIDGQSLLIGLEFASRGTPVDEVGAFLTPAGLKYSIDTTIESTIEIDENNMYIAGPTGEYRVKDVEIYNKETATWEALDVNKIYRVAGNSYNFRQNGDGFTMFADNGVLVKDYVGEDYAVTAEYLKAFKDTIISSANSPLASYENYLINYEDPNGSGRITLITE